MLVSVSLSFLSFSVFSILLDRLIFDFADLVHRTRGTEIITQTVIRAMRDRVTHVRANERTFTIFFLSSVIFFLSSTRSHSRARKRERDSARKNFRDSH